MSLKEHTTYLNFVGFIVLFCKIKSYSVTKITPHAPGPIWHPIVEPT